MKNLIIISMVLAAFSISAYGQVKVPDVAKAAFSKKFPNAQSVKWSEEKEGKAEVAVYEAEFKLNGKVSSANFNSKGEWQETELTVVKADLPAVVLKTVESQFAGYKLGEMASVETPAGKSFEILMSKGKDKIEVIIDPQGKVIKKTDAKEEEDEEKEDGK
ncbi:MAG: hypothetical protein D4R64_16490 [Porphyromonadaceae bacterium]|nr:MAG: hypothetical protein D4R64_16490 [Porphyromonadaceae bacterium]